MRLSLTKFSCGKKYLKLKEVEICKVYKVCRKKFMKFEKKIPTREDIKFKKFWECMFET